MDKNTRLPTKTSRGRGWRNHKRPAQQFYVPGALQRKKLEGNTDNPGKIMGEQSINSAETPTDTLQCAKIQQKDGKSEENVGKLSVSCTETSKCTRNEQNTEKKMGNVPDGSLVEMSQLKQEEAPEQSKNKSNKLDRDTTEILSCSAQCEDQEQNAENRGETMVDQSIEMPPLVAPDESKSKHKNNGSSNELMSANVSSKNDANCPAQTLSCEGLNTQGSILPETTCTKPETPNEHRKTVDISPQTIRDSTELDNCCTESTIINDFKESNIVLSSDMNKSANENVEKMEDKVKNNFEKDLIVDKITCEKSVVLRDITQEDKDSENVEGSISVDLNNDVIQTNKIHTDSSSRKEENENESCLLNCEVAESNDIAKKVNVNSECTEMQSCGQTSNENIIKDNDCECTNTQTKESNREDRHCDDENTSKNLQNVGERDLQNEHDLQETNHLCSEETGISSTNETENNTVKNCSACCETVEAAENRVTNNEPYSLDSNVSSETKAEISHLKDTTSHNSTKKINSTVSETKGDQSSILDKSKKKKKSKKSDHLETKEGKKKKKNKKEHCENSKDEDSRSKDEKSKSAFKGKVKEKEEVICKEDILDQDKKLATEDDVDDDDDDDTDSWLNKFNDDGECLDPELIKELSKVTGIKKPSKHKTQFDFYSLAEKDIELDDDYGHIVEIYDFSADLKTQDLAKALSIYKDQGYELKWVDDTHALAAFASRIAEFLQPYKPRPQTTKLTAHMLVTHALGVKSRMTKEEKQKERDKLKEAKEQKKQEKQRKAAVWED